MKLWQKNTILVIILVLIIALPLALKKDAEFAGTDGQASSVVEEITPGYEPWASSPYEPQSGEIESLLFCVQAAIGAGIVGFALGRITKEKQK